MRIFKLNYIVAALIAALTFSCALEGDENFYNLGDSIHFTSNSTSASESEPEVVSVLVVFTSAQGIGSPTATFELSGTAVEGEDFTVLNTSTTLSFPNGVSDTIKFLMIDNADVDGTKEIQINLSNANAQIGLPGPAANQGSHKVIINDDDCPLDLQAFAAISYHVCEIGYGPTDFATVELGTAPNTLVVQNLGDWGIGDAILTFNPEVSTSLITIEKTFTGAGVGGLPVFWSGSGRYIACTKEFQVTYQIIFEDDSPWAPGAGTNIFTVDVNDGCAPLF